MNKKDVIEQFKQIRAVIDNNLQTIHNLFSQSESLSSIISKMTGKDCDEELKNQLESSQKEINKNITSLIEQTNKLFESYKILIGKIFD